MNGQAAAAAAAFNDATEQRGSFARRALCIPPSPVFAQALHVRPVAVPRDVRRKLVAQQHLPFFWIGGRTWTARTTAEFFLGIDVAATVSIRARVDRVAK